MVTYREFCLDCIFRIQTRAHKENADHVIGIDMGYLEMVIRNEIDLDLDMPKRGKAFENYKMYDDYEVILDE